MDFLFLFNLLKSHSSILEAQDFDTLGNNILQSWRPVLWMLNQNSVTSVVPWDDLEPNIS